jgi:hypothetical protein
MRGLGRQGEGPPGFSDLQFVLQSLGYTIVSVRCTRESAQPGLGLKGVPR